MYLEEMVNVALVAECVSSEAVEDDDGAIGLLWKGDERHKVARVRVHPQSHHLQMRLVSEMSRGLYFIS